jgi:hypothetical protein
MSDEPDEEGVADEATPPGEDAPPAPALPDDQRERIDAFFEGSGAQNTSRSTFEEAGSGLFRRTRVVLGLVLLGAALAAYVAAGLERAETQEMEQWPVVAAQIRSSSTVSQLGVDVIRYEVNYVVGGQNMRQEVTMSARAGAPSVGDVIPLRVHPDRPSRAVVAQAVGERVVFSDKAVAAPLALGVVLLVSLLVF